MSTEPGYTAPAVTVATSLPKRGLGSAVLIVPIVTGSVTGSDGDGSPKVVGGPFLDAEAIGEIEVGLRALGAKVAIDELPTKADWDDEAAASLTGPSLSRG